MKQTLLILITGLLLFSTCKKKDDGILYFIDITGVSSDTLKTDDTLEVYMDWINSEPTGQVEAFFGDKKSQVIGLTNENNIELSVPSGWNEEYLKIVHPNGAEATLYQDLCRNNYPQVFSVNPTSGAAGDIITITGKEFLASEKTAMRINTLDCEIVEMYDSLIRFKVPDSCGNGLIKLLYWYGDPLVYCTHDITLDVALFNFETTSTIHRTVLKYKHNGFTTYLIERDAEGRVAKRIHLDDDGSPKYLYDTFIYGADGLLETINTFYDSGARYKYKVYSRNHDGSKLEMTSYYDDNEFIEKVEIHYQNGKMIQKDTYWEDEGTINLQFSKQYTYEENKGTVTTKFYNSNGEITSVYIKDVEYDIYNNGFPDPGIPGFEILQEYPSVRKSENKSDRNKIFYNEMGELIRIDGYYNCRNRGTTYFYEYE